MKMAQMDSHKQMDFYPQVSTEPKTKYVQMAKYGSIILFISFFSLKFAHQ